MLHISPGACKLEQNVHTPAAAHHIGRQPRHRNRLTAPPLSLLQEMPLINNFTKDIINLLSCSLSRICDTGLIAFRIKSIETVTEDSLATAALAS